MSRPPLSCTRRTCSSNGGSWTDGSWTGGRAAPSRPPSLVTLVTPVAMREAGYRVDGLPGTADDELGPDLEQAKARFLASEWASREPVAVELPIETVVDGVPLRGRIDAVFPDPRNAKGVVIVDWKSSRPTTGDRLRARTLQLSAYRVAYARRPPPRARDAEEDLRRHVAALRTGGERDG